MPSTNNRPERQGIQLAQPATEKKVLQCSFEGNIFVQPKLNGERFRVQWFFDEPYFISSYGNEFKFLDHLRSSLIEFYRKTNLQPTFDGEIYKHGWPRERIDSALRRKKNFNPDVLELEAHIFDIQEQLEQWQRFKLLNDYEQKFDLFSLPGIKKVNFEVIPTSNWMLQCTEYISLGYEGVIIRHPRGIYTNPGGHGVAKRPVEMLKFKPTEKDIYTITGYTEGTGWATGMLGAFEVQGHDGTRFNVGTGRELTKAKRIEHWKNRDSLVGRQLLVKHEPVKTSGGIPICTVAFELLEKPNA